MRSVDPKVTAHLARTRANVKQYRNLEQRRTGYQAAFALMYVAISLTLLLAAIWLGLWFANRLVAPIRRIIAAAQQVSEGNLSVVVSVNKRQGELAQLGATFNNMTTELSANRDTMIDANNMLDERRRFTEAVLSGVTAGVIGLSPDGEITLLNRSAEQLLNLEGKDLTGELLVEIVPEFTDIVESAKDQNQSNNLVQEQVDFLVGTSERNFAVRVTREETDREDHGFVLTFDDITELVTAQRTTAWSDVARRIAHEIKNPLTPIQLSAERLKRKYGKAVTEDRETFDKCTDTIIRHVGDIGRMVDEFSSFARMPKPVMEEVDLAEIVKDAVILFQMSTSKIDFDFDIAKERMMMFCDRRLITQAVTNLVKNASEAIATRIETDTSGDTYRGRIIVGVSRHNDGYKIDIIDNGCGLPKERRNRLVEPYMTTRVKGTGLGLAIVKKITEQHRGILELQDAPASYGFDQGSRIRMILQNIQPASRQDPTSRTGAIGDPNKNSDADDPTIRQEQGVTHGV